MFEELRARLVREDRIYIMPSLKGVVFLFMVVVMILTGATYNNNLVFVLAFFLFAFFIVSMLQTHYNLKGVRLDLVSVEEGFEGDRVHVLFHVTKRRARSKRRLEIRTLSRAWKSDPHVPAELPAAEDFRPQRVALFANRRGVYPLPAFSLETYFPLGLFRAWKVFRPKGELVIFPRPEGSATLPPQMDQKGEEELGLRSSPDGDFGELKEYQSGESYHQIAWKVYARTGELYSKVMWGSEAKHYHIAWNKPPQMDIETYLKQMSRWVQQALDDDASFSMQTPQGEIEAGRGQGQAIQCWRALARISA